MFILYPEKVLTTKSAHPQSGVSNGILHSKGIYQSTEGIIMVLFDSKTLNDNKIYYSKFDTCNLNLIRDLWTDISYCQKFTCVTLDEFKDMVCIKDLSIENSYVLYCPETGSKFHIGDKMILRSNTHVLQNRYYIFDRVTFPRFQRTIPGLMNGSVEFIDTCVVELRDVNSEDGERIILINKDCCDGKFYDVGYCTFFDDYRGERFKGIHEEMERILSKLEKN